MFSQTPDICVPLPFHCILLFHMSCPHTRAVPGIRHRKQNQLLPLCWNNSHFIISSSSRTLRVHTQQRYTQMTKNKKKNERQWQPQQQQPITAAEEEEKEEAFPLPPPPLLTSTISCNLAQITATTPAKARNCLNAVNEDEVDAFTLITAPQAL
jgi:hypothetical protein